MQREREELEALMRSQGWAILEQALERDSAEELRQAGLDPSSQMALQTLRWAIVRQEARRQVFRWPKDRIATLTRIQDQRQDQRDERQVPTFSRRGTL